MALLRAEANKLSEFDTLRGVIEEYYTTDQLFGMLDYQSTNGKALVYNREGTLATGAWLDVNTDVPEQASTFTQHTSVLKINAGDVDVDKFLDGTQSDLNSQKAIQIASKLKGMSREFRSLIINGDESGNPLHFNGLKTLVEGDRTIVAGANGAALSFSALDELVDAVDTGADAIIMRKGTYRAYKALLRSLGGTDPQMVKVNEFGLMMPSHDGTPILVNDWITDDEVQGTNNDSTSIYAVNFDPAVGFHMIHGGNSPAGFVIEDIGTVQNRDATRTRLKQYVGSVLKSTASISRLQGISNT
jgi:hypothetical protein